MANVITLKNLSHAFADKVIFDATAFKFTDQEKVCIVGDNGTGKSTLLKIIAGQFEPDDVAIEKDARIRCHYIPQEFPKEDLDLTIEGYIQKYCSPGHFQKVFNHGNQLGFDLHKNKDKVCRSLSGGQQKILALSVGVALAPNFLLLDEPENHLDIVSRLELMDILRHYRGGVLFVSHDQLMIDSVAEKVAEVADHKIHLSEGGYQEYINNRLARIAGLQKAFDTEAKRIRQMEASISILAKKAFRGKEVSAYRRAKEELAELKDSHSDGRPEDKRTQIKIKQNNAKLHDGKLLLRLTDATFRYPELKTDTFRKVNLEIRSGSHVVLLGRNGSGKSTLLKCLTGDLPLSAGEVFWADGISFTYFDQHAEFDHTKTPTEVVKALLKVDTEKARAILGSMKFVPRKMDTAIANLSGGERMRIRFGLVFGPSPDFIILDEPTNHLDEVTWQILLEACNNSKSTIFLVTHDYEFIQEFNPKTFWLLKNSTIEERAKELEDLVEELRS